MSSTSDYASTVEFLYNSTPQFQRIGAAAYKPGLDTARQLDAAFGNPHLHYPTIHVAGTNGKGSTAHTLAAILQSAGYRVGLYTSPHLVDFRERIRVNGEMISEHGVVDFVNRYKAMNVGCEPSFFELTTIMAFDWFNHCNVDVAVIETGLGGRLDTTNIITPVLSIITNISFDHVAQLGNTIESIAGEKAGIMKPGVPALVSESDTATRAIFEERAREVDTTVTFATDGHHWDSVEITNQGNLYHGTTAGEIVGALSGECQVANARGILAACDILSRHFSLSPESIKRGFKDVIAITSLSGRWMITSQEPLTVCDTGHNTGGWEYIGRRLAKMPRPLAMVVGFVNDKDVDHILPFMPGDAQYYFTQASIPRAMEASRVAELASLHGLSGVVVTSVKEAVEAAKNNTPAHGSIFVGGSTFVVADFLA